MVTIGARPVLWHVMKYYAHFGHKDFILCLGYKANVIKNYFLDYEESVSNDFVFSHGGRKLDFMQRDIDDWTITFVDTGLRSTIADRLRLVEPYLNGEDDLPRQLQRRPHRFLSASDDRRFSRARLLRVFHFGATAIQQSGPGPSGRRRHRRAIKSMKESNIWVNGGYFLLRKEIFRYIKPGEELVYEPLRPLISEGKVWSPRYAGFWQCMDTFKDKQILDELEASGERPGAFGRRTRQRHRWLRDQEEKRMNLFVDWDTDDSGRRRELYGGAICVYSHSPCRSEVL